MAVWLLQEWCVWMAVLTDCYDITVFEKVMYSYDAKPQEIAKRSYRTFKNLILYEFQRLCILKTLF